MADDLKPCKRASYPGGYAVKPKLMGLAALIGTGAAVACIAVCAGGESLLQTAYRWLNDQTAGHGVEALQFVWFVPCFTVAAYWLLILRRKEAD